MKRLIKLIAYLPLAPFFALIDFTMFICSKYHTSITLAMISDFLDTE